MKIHEVIIVSKMAMLNTRIITKTNKNIESHTEWLL